MAASKSTSPIAPMVNFPTTHLPQTDIFRFVGEELSVEERIEISHKRAKAVAMCYNLTLDDVLTLSQSFWNMHIDPINGFDGAMVTLWTLQHNLSGGTLAPFAKARPELRPLMDSMLSFDVTAHYMLTEVGHGLDAPNIETIATLLPDGQFDLHTPHPQAAKFMPATIPSGNLPRIAVVMARLKIKGRDFGIQPFIVALNDGKEMCRGITSCPMPTRCGSKPLGHAITYFDHVRLPATALLGDLKPPKNPRLQFLSNIWRIGIGSICLTAVTIPGLKLAAYITAKYSMRRSVTSPQGKKIPIISFRTQQKPILAALAQAFALEAAYQEFRQHYTNVDASSLELRNGFSTIFKATAIRHWRESSITLADRCGAQGLFEHNQIIPMQMEVRGVTIAEGDIVVLSIRLASELILGRYAMPVARYPDSLLARHEQGVLADMRTLLAEVGGTHRGEAFNRRLLPRSVALVEAIGLRMVYEAARDAGVDAALVRLYEAGAVLLDIAWYVQHGLLTYQQAYDMEEQAESALLPRLDELLDATGAAPYAFAAIVSDESWEKFVKTLPVLKGDAEVDALQPLRNIDRARL